MSDRSTLGSIRWQRCRTDQNLSSWMMKSLRKEDFVLWHVAQRIRITV